MADTTERLSGRLRSEGEKTLDFFRHLSQEQWEQTVYSEGIRWLVRDVLAHFVSAESSFNRLITNVLSGGSGAPEDFDIDRFNLRQVSQLQESSLSDLLGKFSVYRQANVELVSGLHAEDLSRIGRHPFLGVVPLSDIIKMIYRHNQIHLRDLKRIVMS